MSRRLAYLGPAGTFSEEAALRYDAEAQLLPFASVAAVAAAVDSGMADQGVAAIENSLEGSVNDTLDVLIHESGLSICHELVLPIEHCLLAAAGTLSTDISVVYSHPQPLGQCRHFLERCFPKAELTAALSTAAAVQEAVAHQGTAAIGTRRAAAIYGAEVLAHGIQDNPSNLTRFVVLASEDCPPSGRDKTSIAFSVAHDRPGTLVGVLHEFSDRQINLTKIESRPSKQELGVYIFLLDVDGHHTDPALAEALGRVRDQAFFFRVLGSYPRYTAPA